MTTPDANTLFDALTSGDDDRAEAAARALGQLGDEVMLRLRELLSHPDPDRRWWATRALAEVNSDAAAAALIDSCADPDADVRACAIHALGLGGERAGGAIPVLIQHLSDSSAYVGQLAADSLALIGKHATPALIEALKTGTPSVRGRAARALSQIADLKSIPALIAALDDESPIVEYYADIALQKMGVGTILLKV
jgi:HEAT repeat protein